MLPSSLSKLFIAVRSPNLVHQHWGDKETLKCPNHFDWDCSFLIINHKDLLTYLQFYICSRIINPVTSERNPSKWNYRYYSWSFLVNSFYLKLCIKARLQICQNFWREKLLNSKRRMQRGDPAIHVPSPGLAEDGAGEKEKEWAWSDLKFIIYIRTSLCDHLSQATTSHKRSSIQITKILPVKALKKREVVTLRCHGSRISGSQQTVVLQIWRPCRSVCKHLPSLMSQNRLIVDETTKMLNILKAVSRCHYSDGNDNDNVNKAE